MKLNILTPVIGNRGIWALLIFTFFLGSVRSFAQEGDAEAGAALFKNNCASCHHPHRYVYMLSWDHSNCFLERQEGRSRHLGEAE